MQVKGSGQRIWYVPWIDALEQERQRYLTALQLNDAPQRYLIQASIAQKPGPVSRNLVWRLMKRLFAQVIDFFPTAMISPIQLAVLQQASPH